MNYFRIGQQIRKYRKAYGLSQEMLAEKVGISVTHMSHIETGNTKLSLPVFVDLVRALEVKADDLLFERKPCREIAWDELNSVLEGCTPRQLQIITEIAKSAKIALDKHQDKE